MTHELDRERDRKHSSTHLDRDGAVPGRRSASASLDAPNQPIVSGLLMRKGGGAMHGDAEAAVTQAASSSGHELPGDLRSKFESSLGTDLSSVRVHTGSDSHVAADAVGARAYATGNDIHFNAGEYDPHSSAGQQLIAHEVAHTVQQRGGSPARQNKLAVSHAGDGFEQEADRAASAMVTGSPFSLASAPNVIARNPKDDKPQQPGKADAKTGSLVSRSVGFKMFGKDTTVTFNPDGSISGADLTLDKLSSKAKLAELKVPPIATQAGPVGIMLKVEGDVTAKASASLKLTGGKKTFDGPMIDNEGYEAKVVGSGSVEIAAEGTLKALPYVGASFANVNAGGYVKLSASAKMQVKASGGLEIDPQGGAHGTAAVKVGTDLTVTGSGGITVGYEALIASGTFYEVELASHDFFSMGVSAEGGYDFGSGTTSEKTDVKPPVFKPIRWGQPKIAQQGIKNAAQNAVNKVKAEEKRKGNDIDGQKSVDPNATGEANTPTGCDASTSTCDNTEEPGQ